VQVPVAAPVGPHLHHPQPGRGPQGVRERGGRVRPAVRGAGGGAQRGEIRAVRRREHPLERGRVVGATLLQQAEDAAAVVVHHDDRQVGPGLVRADHEARRVVEEREVPHQRVRRPAADPLVGERGADRRGHHPVDPGEAAVREHPDVLPRRGGQIRVPDRLRGAEHQQPVVG
jgi:hypothetical protein